MFRKAERKQVKLRLALCAPSGAGKTYSALLLAKGLGGKVALLDTENGSGDLYSHLFDYDVATITENYDPKKYIEIIKNAEKSGYNVLIIDSLSHAWNAEGGILDTQNKAERASKSQNGYYAWRDVTPLHNALVNAILQSNMHIICTMRTKMAYEVSKNSSGKLVPIKIGMAPIQREGMEYEFSVVLDISTEGHLSSCSKDRTMLFDGKNFVITEQTGEDLLVWLNSGKNQDEEIDELLKTIKESMTIEALKEAWSKAVTFKFHPRFQEIEKEKDRIKDFIVDAGNKIKGEAA